MSEPLLVQLVRTLARPIGESDRQRARLHLLDWLACVAGARESVVGIAFRKKYRGVACDRAAAALGNFLEMDDVHRVGRLHPGPAVWPAALRARLDDLGEMLDAAIKGYDAMIALGETLDDFHYERWHPTATAGVAGAAMAYGAAGKLCEERQVWALGNAISVAGGLWHMRHAQVHTKQWHLVHVLHTGEEACWVAEGGVTGPANILEGSQGLYAATCRQPKPMTFPEQWRIHEVSFKPWAACRHAHPAIDCALELRAAGRLEAPFHVETYADGLAFCDNPHPTTETEAKFSLQHAVAVIADGRKAEPADFMPEAIAALAPLRAQVTVSEAPEITARYPAHFGARVNGLELVDTRGDPERPVGAAEIVAKMHMLAKWGGLAASEADRAADLALNGDDAGAIVEMLAEWLA